jgi:hypothetical protein
VLVGFRPLCIGPFSPQHFALLFPPGVFHTSGAGGRFAPAFEDTVRPQRIFWILLACSLFAISGHAQQAPRPAAPPQAKDPNSQSADVDETQERIVRDLAKKANVERHAGLKADTDKLLKLAVELKDSVDKSNENVLSLEVIKKAEEIEKLAHSVRDKMKGPN